MKVLNLYSGLGGNRWLWPDDVEVMAVEQSSEVAAYYRKHFPGDQVVIGDAHDYLLNHFSEFEFIWSSPPCPTHSRARKWAKHGAVYPSMSLYQEILLLENYFEGAWCVENVIPYYPPLIPAQQFSRHLFWCSRLVRPIEIKGETAHTEGSNKAMADWYGMPYESITLNGRTDTPWRNCVHPKIGQHIFHELTFSESLI